MLIFIGQNARRNTMLHFREALDTLLLAEVRLAEGAERGKV
jgi:hypothetical protein